MKEKTLIPMDHSIIYDKMWLFLQREGKNELAIRFGIFSYISWIVGLKKQKRKDELITFTSEKTIEETLRKLCRKEHKEDLLEKLSKIVIHYLQMLSNVDFVEFTKEIDVVIFSEAWSSKNLKRRRHFNVKVNF
jgi:hypothetical protein